MCACCVLKQTRPRAQQSLLRVVLWTTAAGLSQLNLCSNVTSEQVWQMDYLNMWASNHRVQSSNPSDTGSAKHTAELGDNDPNHDKSAHSSTTAMSRLKRVIKRVILARWVCQSEEWKLTRVYTPSFSLSSYSNAHIISYEPRLLFHDKLITTKQRQLCWKNQKQSAAGKLKTAHKCHTKTFLYYFPKALTFLWWVWPALMCHVCRSLSDVSVCRCSFEWLIIGIKTSAYTSHPQQWNHSRVSNNNHLVLALF